MRRLALLLAACAVSTGLTFAQAVRASDYPAKPVRILAGSPGTLMDVSARHVALRLSEKLGQPVVVENRGGAGFTIGAAAAAKAPPDGYTLVMADRTALASAPFLYKDLAYDSLRDFAPIALVATAPLILAAHPGVGGADLQSFLKSAVTRADVSWASSGISTGSHITTERLRMRAGIKPVYVHYKGSSEAQRAILSGEPQVGFISAPSTLSLVAAGQLRALAVSSPQRLPAAPEIPTLAEAGFAGMEYEYWVGLLAPARTPAVVISRIRDALAEILKGAEFRAALASQGATAANPDEDFAARIVRDHRAAREDAALTGAVPQ